VGEVRDCDAGDQHDRQKRKFLVRKGQRRARAQPAGQEDAPDRREQPREEARPEPLAPGAPVALADLAGVEEKSAEFRHAEEYERKGAQRQGDKRRVFARKREDEVQAAAQRRGHPVGDQHGDAPAEIQRARGDGKGDQHRPPTEHRREQAVERSHGDADEQRAGHGGPFAGAAAHHLGDDHGRQRADAGLRHIRATRGEGQRHAEGHHPGPRNLNQHVAEVERAREVSSPQSRADQQNRQQKAQAAEEPNHLDRSRPSRSLTHRNPLLFHLKRPCEAAPILRHVC